MSYRYPFSHANEVLKRQVWAKAFVIDGYNPSEIRSDRCGKVMMYAHHGDTNSQYGWEIDHIIPVAKGGGNQIDNLQPLNWRNNRRKGDTFPWHCGM